MQNITFIPTTEPKQKPETAKLGFGKHFTDHMFVMEYSPDKGWHDARIVPFDRISMHPASTVFHYGAEIFEGLKAYKTPNGDIQLFRPTENIARLNSDEVTTGTLEITAKKNLEGRDLKAGEFTFHLARKNAEGKYQIKVSSA